mgnify:CR=1 FL=1
MKLFVKMITIAGMAAALVSCADKAVQGAGDAAQEGNFKYLMDEFADLKIMRYQVPGWDALTLKQKEYVYYLSEAAKYGRDIIWMQNCKYNLDVRKALEAVLENYQGDRTCEEYKAFETYAKRVFFSNGIHHHYAEDKFFPECPQEYFAELLAAVKVENADFLLDLMYNPSVFPQRKSTDKTGDIVAESAKRVTALPRAINLIGTQDGQDLLIPRIYLYTSTEGDENVDPIYDICIDANPIKEGWVTARSELPVLPWACRAASTSATSGTWLPAPSPLWTRAVWANATSWPTSLSL